jgi:hypothetical protein
VNLAFVKASYTLSRVRGNLAFAAGTYVNANYVAEPGVLKNLYEANIQQQRQDIYQERWAGE